MTATLTLEEFRAKVEQHEVACQIPGCGYKAHSLVRHLKNKHNLSVGQYKDRYKKAPVASPIASEILRQIPRTVKSSESLEPYMAAFEGAASAEGLFQNLRSQFSATAPENLPFVPKVDDAFYFDDKIVKSVCYGLVQGKNIYIEGPTGCGKTDGALQIHAQLGLPAKRVNMNGDVTVANFIGTREADPAKGTYFKYGNLPNAMRAGITLIIDEIDYTPPAIAAVLNPVLERGRTLYLPDVDETIIAAKGFNVIGTGNTGGKGDSAGVYTGTEIMNTALLDRFPIKMTQDYLPMKEEMAMLVGRFPGKDSALIQKLVQFAVEIRRSFTNGTLPVTVSTRKLIDILEAEKAIGLRASLEAAIVNWLDNDNRPVVDKILDNCGLVK